MVVRLLFKQTYIRSEALFGTYLVCPHLVVN